MKLKCLSTILLGLSISNSSLASASDKSIIFYNNFAQINSESQFKDGKATFSDIPKEIIRNSISLSKDVSEYSLVSNYFDISKIKNDHIGRTIKIKNMDKGIYEESYWWGTLLGWGKDLIVSDEKGYIHNIKNDTAVWYPNLKSFDVDPHIEVFSDEYDDDENIDISYLSKNLTWSAKHILVIRGNKKGGIKSYIVLNNQTDKNLSGIHASVFAGEAPLDNNVTRYSQRSPIYKDMAVSVAGVMRTLPSSSSKNGSYKFSISKKIDLKNHSSKTIPLSSERNIDVDITNEFNVSHSSSSDTPHHAVRYISFTNDSRVDNIIIPRGSINIYSDGMDGKTFVGSRTIQNTAVGEEIRLSLGRSVDVSLTAKTVKLFKKMPVGKKDEETAISTLKISNNSNKPSNAVIRINLPWNVSSVGKFIVIGSRSRSIIADVDKNVAIINITIPSHSTTTGSITIKRIK